VASLAFGQTATETFTYTMRDGAGVESTATVTVTVNGQNHAPTATDDSATAVENGAAITINVLANDSDSDPGDTLTVTGFSASGLQGAVTQNADGSFNYAVGNAFQSLLLGGSATETFSYTVADSQGAASTAQVVVRINGANDEPVAVTNTLSLSEDAAPTTINVLANDTDVDAGDSKTIVSVDTTGLQGSVAIAADGSSLVYTVASAFQNLNTGQSATETFSYTMRDGAGAQSTATVTLTIVGANEPVIYVNPPAPPAGAILGTSGDEILNGTAGADHIYGRPGDDEISGLGGNDAIFGEADDDTLNGDAGNDTLNGGAGRDDLEGGAGADTFRFYLASESTLLAFDRIRDFSHGDGDKIDVSLIDANVQAADNNAFTLVSAFTGVAGQLYYANTASGLMVYGDINGDAVADLAFEVRVEDSLSGADFIL
jgi:VCBS repeat-containing protein